VWALKKRRAGRPGELINLIVRVLLESKDNCVKKMELVRKLVKEHERRVDSVERSLEIAFKRGKIKFVDRIVNGVRETFVCLEDPEIVEHKEYVLSILEDIYLRMTSRGPLVEVKMYEPVSDARRRRGLLLSVVDHLLNVEEVFRATEFLVVLSEHADSYLGGAEKACMVKARELCPGLRDPKSIMWVARKLCEALREMVKHPGFEDQIVSGMSEGIASNYDLLRGKQDKIARALRELYDYIGYALQLEGELDRFRERQRGAVREVIFNTIKDMVEEGKLIGKCYLCGREAGGEDVWEARVREELRRMLEVYILPPPPAIRNY
jgi:hypothetical protein